MSHLYKNLDTEHEIVNEEIYMIGDTDLVKRWDRRKKNYGIDYEVNSGGENRWCY